MWGKTLPGGFEPAMNQSTKVAAGHLLSMNTQHKLASFHVHSNMLIQRMPSTVDTIFAAMAMEKWKGMCAEVAAAWYGNQKPCRQPAVTIAWDTFARRYYPVCTNH